MSSELVSFQHTVDGWNPAPADRKFIPLFKGSYASQVVQDSFNQQYFCDLLKFLYLETSLLAPLNFPAICDLGVWPIKLEKFSGTPMVVLEWKLTWLAFRWRVYIYISYVYMYSCICGKMCLWKTHRTHVYLYVRPFDDPCFDWSLGLLLEGWPSKTEVIWGTGWTSRP